jgi:hypothetical protein
MPNAANENDVRKAKEKAKVDRAQELEDIRAILRLPAGAGVRFFRRMFDKGKVFHTTFTGNSQTFFLEGHRNLALIFFADLCEAEPGSIHKVILKENFEEGGLNGE